MVTEIILHATLYALKQSPKEKTGDFYLKYKSGLTGSLFADNISSYQPADSCHCCQGTKMQERCCGLIRKDKCEMLVLIGGYYIQQHQSKALYLCYNDAKNRQSRELVKAAHSRARVSFRGFRKGRAHLPNIRSSFKGEI